MGLVRKLAPDVDVSVEWAVGQSARCHSSLRSPVWVCFWGTGTTPATAANKGPLSGSARCTQWHQLSPPTSSSNTHNERERPLPHTQALCKRNINKSTPLTSIHTNKWNNSCRRLIWNFDWSFVSVWTQTKKVLPFCWSHEMITRSPSSNFFTPLPPLSLLALLFDYTFPLSSFRNVYRLKKCSSGGTWLGSWSS